MGAHEAASEGKVPPAEHEVQYASSLCEARRLQFGSPGSSMQGEVVLPDEAPADRLALSLGPKPNWWLNGVAAVR